jgi:hypothetical protein
LDGSALELSFEFGEGFLGIRIHMQVVESGTELIGLVTGQKVRLQEYDHLFGRLKGVGFRKVLRF